MGLVICQTMGRWQLEHWHGCSPAARNSCGREGARETEPKPHSCQQPHRLSITQTRDTSTSTMARVDIRHLARPLTSRTQRTESRRVTSRQRCFSPCTDRMNLLSAQTGNQRRLPQFGQTIVSQNSTPISARVHERPNSCPQSRQRRRKCKVDRPDASGGGPFGGDCDGKRWRLRDGVPGVPSIAPLMSADQVRTCSQLGPEHR